MVEVGRREAGGGGGRPRAPHEKKEGRQPARGGSGGKERRGRNSGFSPPPRPPPPANRIGGVGCISREKCKFFAVSVRYWRKGSEARAGPVRERPLKTWNLVELRWIHTGPHGRVLWISEAIQHIRRFRVT